MIHFSHPLLLHLLWLLPLLLLGWWWTRRRAARVIARFVKAPLLRDLIAHNNRKLQWLGQLLILLAFIITIFAMAGPERAMMGTKQVTVGLDIMLLADTSLSMDAKDVFPSRLERAKRGMIYLVDQLQGHRIGIIQFAGEAFVSCPFTQDKGALKLIIDAMHSRSLPTAGTDITQGLRLALEAFERNGAKHKIIILVSDGENYGAKPFQLVKKGKKKGTRVYCLGTGTVIGSGLTKDQTVIKDAQGLPMVTKLNEKALSKLADFGGGRYWKLTSSGYEEDQLIKELNRLEKINRFTSGYHTWKPIYPWLAIIAGILLMSTLLLGRGSAPAKIILLVFFLLPTTGFAQSYRQLVQAGLEAFNNNDLIQAERTFNQARQKHPHDVLSEYNLGCTLLWQKKLLKAYQAFSRAKTYAKGKILRDSLYNLGYTAFYLGIREGVSDYWLEALDAYKNILMSNPDDDDARYNIEIILREIKKRSKTSAPEQRQMQGSDKGRKDGGGADKPGHERAQSQGRENDQALPREAQEKSQKRQDQGKQPKTSEQQQGQRQKGMSQEEALRTLNSLEAEETSIQKQWQQHQGETPAYQGPGW